MSLASLVRVTLCSVVVTMVYCVSEDEFDAACVNATDSKLLLLTGQRICYINMATPGTYASAKATCQANDAVLGPGELFRPTFPNTSYHVSETMSMATAGLWTSGYRLDTSGPGTSGWFWYDNITQPAIPYDANDVWNLSEPDGSGPCGFVSRLTGLLWDASCGVSKPTICEYVHSPTNTTTINLDTRQAVFSIFVKRADDISMAAGSTLYTHSSSRSFFHCGLLCAANPAVCKAISYSEAATTCRLHNVAYDTPGGLIISPGYKFHDLV